MNSRVRTFVTLFGLGAVVLTLLDSVHVHTGTLAYEHPFAFGSAWWVPLLMGGAASFGGLAYVATWERAKAPRPVASRAALASSLVLFAVLYAASGLSPVSAVQKLIVITIGAVAIFFSVDGTRTGACFMLLGMVVGPAAEAINPGFHYVDPDFMGVPMWLPSLYACVTPAIGQLARALAARDPNHRRHQRAFAAVEVPLVRPNPTIKG
jgi:hypothetical protein